MRARQLLYHRDRIRWMEKRMENNAALLETYLVAQDKQAAVLTGGYAVAYRRWEDRRTGTGGWLRIRADEDT